MKYKRSIAIYSDLHVGSEFAVFPKGHVTSKGNKILLNEGQEKLYKFWLKCLGICRDFKVDTVLFVGDLVQGTNRKNNGEGNLIVGLEGQKEACVELVASLCRNRKVMGISGTDYHGSEDMKVEKQIINRLEGEYFGYVINGDITGTNRTMNVIHGTSNAPIYRETAASREILFLKEAEAQEKTYKSDILIRAHNHFFLHIHKNHVHYIINPCWQVLSPNAYTVRNYFKWQPDIGMSLLLIDEDDRITVHHFLMDETLHITDYLRDV